MLLNPFAWHTLFALSLSAGVIFVLRGAALPAGRVANVLVGALVGGAVGARALYVLLNPAVFAHDWARALNMQTGGLVWHGALWGALAVAWGASRLWDVPFGRVLALAAPSVPLIAFGGWTACRMMGCMAGAEVDTLANFPAWQVAELPDVYGIIAPRYDTARYGQALSMALLLLVVGVWSRADAARATWLFWVVVALFGVGMAGIGIYREASTALQWGTLRADTWLDGCSAGVCGLASLWAWVQRRPPSGSL